MKQVMIQRFESKMAPLIAGILMFILFQSPLSWLFQSLQVSEYRLHSLLLIGFAIFLTLKNWRRNPKKVLSPTKFNVEILPMTLFLSGIIGFVITEKFFDIDVISCLFLGLTVYGFTGFYMEINEWRNSSVFVLLFSVCLPLSYHIETFFGFPLRILSAKVAETFFSLTGSQAHSTETVLLVENKLSHIDLPCSGIKSLWSISLFSLVLSIIEKYKINFWWTISFLSSWLLVASANIFRIILLMMTYSSDFPETVKESLHVPIGMLAFIGACVATHFIFGLTCRRAAPPVVIQKFFDRKSYWIVILILLIAISINQSTNQFKLAPEKTVPPQSQNSADSIALTDKEQGLFLRHGVIQFEKKKFHIRDLRGTAFLVLSNSWRGHHHPEQCIQGQGHLIETTKTLVIKDGLHVRSIKIKNSNNEVAYWFQSQEDLTDDYSSRIWSGLVHPNKPYIMVSLYIENGSRSDPLAFKELINDFHRQTQAILDNRRKNEKQN